MRQALFRLAAIALGLAGLVPSGGAGAQAILPFGFGALPSFAWPQALPDPGRPAWEGSFARLSSGFQVTSSRHFGTVAGPTIGFEGGHLWREGDVLIGIVGGFDYLAPFAGSGTPASGGFAYTRDFAGTVQLEAGRVLTDDVLIYAKAGLVAANETLRFGGSTVALPGSRSQVAVRPDARIGVEWAATDRLTLGLEAGITGPNLTGPGWGGPGLVGPGLVGPGLR